MTAHFKVKMLPVLLYGMDIVLPTMKRPLDQMKSFSKTTSQASVIVAADCGRSSSIHAFWIFANERANTYKNLELFSLTCVN